MAFSEEIAQLGRATFILAIILLTIAWISVALRIWVRVCITKSSGWDDTTMVATLCLFTCYCTFILILVTTASQEDNQWTAAELLQSLVYVQLAELFYILTTTFLKISLGLFFLRLLTIPWQRRLFKIVLIISGAYGLFYFFATTFICGNPAKLADALLGGKECAPTSFSLTIGYIYGVINILADWTFTLIPIVILMDSKMDRRSKISISVVMAFAAIGSISSILRMVYLKSLLVSGRPSSDSIKATIWATAEPGTGIIAASVAILRPLFRKMYLDIHGILAKLGFVQPYEPSRIFEAPRKMDTESIIGLTTVASRDDARNSIRSIDVHVAWDDIMNAEQIRIVVDKSVLIKTRESVSAAPSYKK